MTRFNDSDIAIVGLSCIFPGAGDIKTYWNNIISKVDALKTAPDHRVDSLYYDPSSSDIDRVYCNRGGFIDEFMDFDPIEFGIVPNTIKGTEPDHFLSLKMTHRALEDAGVFEKRISLDNAGIIIGKGGYGGIEGYKLYEIIIGAESLVKMLRVTAPLLTEDDLNRIKKEYQQQRGHFGPQCVMGTVPNITAAMVANRFNFGGPAYTVDAACASSTIAIDNAVKELLSNRCDLVVAGAIHISQNPALWSVFSLLGAFSKSQVVRPFDKKADGVLPGEGCGFVVLRRLKDAIRDDQRIYAVIKGVGVSSDGSHASLMSPSWQGQTKSIKYAWKHTGIDFSQIGYIEAHGTATILGDKTELHSLREIFPSNDKLPKAGIGSVKSMIGHAMPAAGMAGFIKTVMALHHGILPPTLNCDEPVEALNETRFQPVQDAIEWGQTDLPFIAGVNAFGFGGANSHIVIEKFNARNSYEKKYNIPFEFREEDKVLLLARNSREELLSALENNSFETGSGNYRLALFNPTPQRISLAKRIVTKDVIWRNKQDLWYTNQPLLSNGGKLAFMFPGLDGPGLMSIKTSNFNAVAEYFNLPESDFYNHTEGIKQILGLDESCRLMDTAFKKLGLVPDFVAGHSAGEWTACGTVGMVDDDTIARLNEIAINKKNEDIDAVFLSVSCSAGQVQKLIEEYPSVYLTNDNCPTQVVVCAKRSDAEKFRGILNDLNILSYVLPFETGYHSPFAERYVEEVRYNVENVVNLKLPERPIWSSITAKPYPGTIEEIKKLHVDFVTKPVLFRQLVENLYNEGANVFVQIGAGSISGFIGDILKDKEHSVVSSASLKREALNQMKRVLASVFVEGREVNYEFLGLNVSDNPGNKKKKASMNIKLELSMPFIDFNKIFTPGELQKIRANDSFAHNYGNNVGTSEILKAFNKNVEEINQTQKELLALLSHRKHGGLQQTGSPIVKRMSIEKKIEISLEKFPELIDHSPFRKVSSTADFKKEWEPVVPLTMFIDLFVETFNEFYPADRITKIKQIKAYQFLWAIKPVEITITGTWLNENSIEFEVDKYFKATLVINEPVQDDILHITVSNAISNPIRDEEIYSEGYMFHGPSYAGIRKIIAFSGTAMETLISGTCGKGAMLDNIGQTFGLFLHLINKNLRAFPVGAEEFIFFQDPADQSGEFTCSCTISKEDEEFLYSNLELRRDGKRWCYVKNWQVRKSEIDHDIWSMMNRAEEKRLAKTISKGLTIMPMAYKKPNTWFTILNIYLNAKEIEMYNSFSVAKQKEWLLGRVAAKDAIRDIQLNPSHPATYTILNDASGKPFVENIEGLNISIAHKRQMAIAYTSFEKKVGVDIEEIKTRDESFIDLVLSDDEKKLIERFENKDEWITRIWVAKECYGKYLGEGIKGNPKIYNVSRIEGTDLYIENVKITTEKIDNLIIGFTNN